MMFIKYSSPSFDKKWSYKRGGPSLEVHVRCIINALYGACRAWSLKRGSLPQEWSPKRGTTVSFSCSGGDVQFILNKLLDAYLHKEMACNISYIRIFL